MQALMKAPKSMSVPGTTKPDTAPAPPPATTAIKGVDDISGKSRDDAGECAADDDCYCQIHDIATINEFLELGEEFFSCQSFPLSIDKKSDPYKGRLNLRGVGGGT